jgi:hypothetical protein
MNAATAGSTYMTQNSNVFLAACLILFLDLMTLCFWKQLNMQTVAHWQALTSPSAPNAHGASVIMDANDSMRQVLDAQALGTTLLAYVIVRTRVDLNVSSAQAVKSFSIIILIISSLVFLWVWLVLI